MAISTRAFPLYMTVAAILFGIAAAGCDMEEVVEDIGDDQFILLANIDLLVPEPSGLALDLSGNSLWTVSDNTGKIYRMDLEGNILHEQSWSGEDLEGVTQSPVNGHLFVVEEARMEVVEIDTFGNEINRFEVTNISEDPSSGGLEGIGYDSANDRLLLLNEKQPSMLLYYSTSGSRIGQMEYDLGGDVSGICFDPDLNLYWLVSDELKQLMAFDMDNNLIHARDLNLSKMEGVAVSEDRIYLVSDSNENLYVFPKAEFFPAEMTE